jgi:hypothetical protein
MTLRHSLLAGIFLCFQAAYAFIQKDSRQAGMTFEVGVEQLDLYQKAFFELK